jgi:hypothetical protein
MISKITYSKVISTAFLFFSMLLNFTIVFAQSRTASYEFIDADTKGYASMLVPDWLSNNPNDEEVMAVGSKLDPNNPNATTTALHLVRYNNLGQLIVNRIIDDINANERAVSICLYDPKTFVILSSYSIPGSSPNYKAKLTFVDVNGKIWSEELLKIVPPLGSYDNVFPMHAVMYQNELYICGALQSGSGSSGVGLDFTLPKAGFVYNYNTQQTGVIEPNSPTPGNQYYTLAKRLRKFDNKLFVVGMYDHDFSNSSGNLVNGPTPFYAKVNLPFLSSSSFSDFNILSNLMGCASDINENSAISGDYIVLSQGMTNQNTSSNPTALVTTTGVYLSYIPNPTTAYTVNLTQVDNQTATSMYKDPFNPNKIIIAGWEQRISSPLYPILGGNTNTVLFPNGPRDNAFLYDVDYSLSPFFNVTVNDYSVFANLINNTQSYRNLGGPNMSNFYLLPDNAIQRDPALANGYIISTLYKNKQPSNFFHGLKTIYTNNITSCDVVLNPYYSTPYNLMGSPNSFSPPTLPILPNISIVNVTVNGSFNNPINSSVEFCENNGKYRLAHNEHLNNEIRIYPNPAYSNAVINVKLNDEWIANSTLQLELKNIEGQVLSTSDILNSNSEFTYTLPSISPGMYFLTLTNASGSKKHFPISVQ